MSIQIDTTLKVTTTGLSKMTNIDMIVLHHRAGTGDVASINTYHKSLGWTCIGYHYYVRTDGTIYQGRPLPYVGAHCVGHNTHSIGICAEGNFENMAMSMKQLESIVNLVDYLKGAYLSVKDIVRHKDLAATACPGANYPYDEIMEKLNQLQEERKNANMTTTTAKDMNAASNWALDVTTWAVDNGLFRGDDTGAMGWKNTITREQAAQVFYNFYKKFIDNK